MTCRSSMKLMIRMIPRHFGQVRGSTFPDQVGDKLRFSDTAGLSSSGTPSNFYRLPGCKGPLVFGLFSLSPGDITAVPIVRAWQQASQVG
jgi:hypothetical protein